MTQLITRSDVVLALVIQWTLVLAAGWVVRALSWRASAATRSAVDRATMICLLAAPVLAIVAAEFRIPQVPVAVISMPASGPTQAAQPAPPVENASAQGVTVQPASAPVNESVHHLSNGAGQVPVHPDAPPTRKRPDADMEPLAPHLLAAGLWAWALVSTGLLVRLSIANLLLQSRRRHGNPAPHPTVSDVQSLARQIGVRAPAVKMSPAVSAACLTGILRPMILLPADCEHGVEREVLVHELAHLLRQDCLWAFASGVLVAVLWWHPLAWVLVRNTERDAEEACDDIVLLHGGERSHYARLLVETASRIGRMRLLPELAPAILSRGSVVGKRVRRLLDSRHAPNTRVKRTVWGALAIYVLAMGTLSACVRAGGGRTAQAVPTPDTAAAFPGNHQGRVIDAAGNPVAGAQVYLLKRGPSQEVIGKMTSDREGRFKFAAELPTNPWDNRYELQTVVPGKGVGEARPEPGKECVIHLFAPTRITLTVLGPDEKPVAGLKVYPASFASMPAHGLNVQGVSPVPQKNLFFMQMPLELYRPMGRVTDERGSVTFENLPRGQGFELGFDDERFARPGMINRIGLAENSDFTPPETVQLEQGATISGVVRYGPTGKAAAGLGVYATPTLNGSPRSLPGGITTTDGSGAYRITGLAAGEYKVLVDLPLDAQKQWAAAGREEVKLEGGQIVKDLDIALARGGIVQGKVITADSAEPIARASVAAVGNASIQSAETRPDGSYSLRVAPGLQHVSVSVVVPEVYRQPRQEVRDLQVEEGQTVTADFRVPKREGETVEGVVIGVDGKPAGGVVVRAQWGFGFGLTSATTDAAGKFRIERIPPDGDLLVDSENYRTALPTPVTNDMAQVRLQLVRKVVLTLKGVITNDVGRPVPNARIQLSQYFESSLTSGLGGPLISDSSGQYEIKDLPGGFEYQLLATAEGHGEARETFAVTDKTKELPTLRMPRADVSTGGIVVDEAGKPVAGATAYLNDGRETRAATTDAQGKFSFPVVRGKRYVAWSVLKGQDKKSAEADAGEGKTDLKLVLSPE